MIRTFTGWHMAGILLGFFGIVISVNVVMATNAVRTFGGVVVDNSYVASQHFNSWLAEARTQDRLGWNVELRGTPEGMLRVRLSDREGPIDGAMLQVEAEHPLGRLPGRSFSLVAIGGGDYAAPHTLGHGRWRVAVDAKVRGREARFLQEVRL
jgi:nitrogen fixation protein FixH